MRSQQGSLWVGSFPEIYWTEMSLLGSFCRSCPDGGETDFTLGFHAHGGKKDRGEEGGGTQEDSLERTSGDTGPLLHGLSMAWLREPGGDLVGEFLHLEDIPVFTDRGTGCGFLACPGPS
ncbi:hypothetical protein NDU88_004019 [Pleurodeles waltl]|uniref:Uncharacterized protein n=1 Tax=Pleurodeles waltl TaxID=8319 RepID=A0AAV7RKA3_PLEWA|nr:hypothetical protein NDU88_004019 [Pleurodeles waltl]